MRLERRVYVDRLVARKRNGMVKVITGIRRCGKSYLLFKLFRDHLIESGVDGDHIIALALDSIENEGLRDIHALYDHLKESIPHDGSCTYILLDEIQLAEGFESLMNSLLRMEDVDVYVTGSNSRFLSSDVITEFRGRGDEVRVRPLSFSEFIEAYDGSAAEAMEEYMDYGGLPELFNMKDDEMKASYLRSVMDATYLLDIRDRNDIRSPYLLDNLVDVLSSSIGSLVNATKLRHTLASSGYRSADEDTVTRYIGFLEDAFIFERARRYDVKGRRYINSTEKYYSADHGLTNCRLGFRQLGDRPHIMENMIYNELRFRGFDVDVGSLSCRESAGGTLVSKTLEVDFVARKGSRMYYIQSAYRMDDDAKIEQELRPLLKIRDSFRKIVIVGGSMNTYMDDSGIVHMGLLQFLTDGASLDSRFRSSGGHNRKNMSTDSKIRFVFRPQPGLRSIRPPS